VLLLKYGLIIVSLALKRAHETSNPARRDLSSQTPSFPILDLCKASPQTILNKNAQIKYATHVPPSQRCGDEKADRERQPVVSHSRYGATDKEKESVKRKSNCVGGFSEIVLFLVERYLLGD
jgi:hypothetical protein